MITPAPDELLKTKLHVFYFQQSLFYHLMLYFETNRFFQAPHYLHEEQKKGGEHHLVTWASCSS